MKRRETDPVNTGIIWDGKHIKVYLNGYAIIPIEEYMELTGEHFVKMADVHAAERDLFPNSINVKDMT